MFPLSVETLLMITKVQPKGGISGAAEAHRPHEGGCV